MAKHKILVMRNNTFVGSELQITALNRIILINDLTDIYKVNHSFSSV